MATTTPAQDERGLVQQEAMSHMNIRTLLNQEAIKDRFREMLGAKAAGFLTSVLQVANSSNMQGVNPMSIYHAAATAATLDLPVVPGLGFAWIVPYSGEAQFQIGYKGYTQLGLRTAQYSRLNMLNVYENQFKKWNGMTEELQADFSIDGEGSVVGYCSYFRLLNGFEKTVFWSHKKVFEHGKKYSKSFNHPKGQWKNDFEAMARKTVLKHALSQWGILSVEMQMALRVDQSVILTEDAERVKYVDNVETGKDKAQAASDATASAIKSAGEKAKEAGGA